MTLLKKLNIECGEPNKNYEDVSVPSIGDGVEIRIQKLKIAAQLRLSQLHKKIEAMNVTDEIEFSLLGTTAMLMCTMVDDQGNYLMPGDDIEATFNYLDEKDVIHILMSASNRVNKVEVSVEPESLENSKKNS